MTCDPISVATPLRIGLAGLGTVGIGVLRLLQTNGALIEGRAGRPVTVTAVSARDRHRPRAIDISGFGWEDDMTALARRDDVDLVVELVGGADGPALALARAALNAGKGFVTANKAMIAHHGIELAERAEVAGLPCKFEAAVAGGIPVVKGLREGAAANRIERIYGILNGTCNFILSEMEATGRDFGETLADAQTRGFAEADPAFDIEGVDAAHKLAILSAIAFGTRLDFASVETGGIDRLRAADIAEADALGYVIRLLGIGSMEYAGAQNSASEADASGKPALLQRVQPVLVPRAHPLAHVAGPTNAVVAEGDFAGRLLFQGAGAGDGPTASAVMADVIDIARGDCAPPFSVPVARLEPVPAADPGLREKRFYLRFAVNDRPGVLAEITAAMRDADVSIASLIQRGQSADGGEVLVMMVTHRGPERCVRQALAALGDSPSLTSAPLALQLLDES